VIHHLLLCVFAAWRAQRILSTDFTDDTDKKTLRSKVIYHLLLCVFAALRAQRILSTDFTDDTDKENKPSVVR
jgi:hypothetical protein